MKLSGGSDDGEAQLAAPPDIAPTQGDGSAAPPPAPTRPRPQRRTYSASGSGSGPIQSGYTAAPPGTTSSVAGAPPSAAPDIALTQDDGSAAAGGRLPSPRDFRGAPFARQQDPDLTTDLNPFGLTPAADKPDGWDTIKWLYKNRVERIGAVRNLKRNFDNSNMMHDLRDGVNVQIQKCAEADWNALSRERATAQSREMVEQYFGEEDVARLATERAVCDRALELARQELVLNDRMLKQLATEAVELCNLIGITPQRAMLAWQEDNTMQKLGEAVWLRWGGAIKASD